jgi:hypothetical protein
MAVKPEDVVRVAEFRNRLVAFANYIDAHRPDYGEDLKPAARQHIGTEQSGLAQDYGRVYKVIQPYGIASMTQFGGIVSQDVVRDAIGRLDHPSHPALAQMAVQHLDVILGHLRAEVEDHPARTTSPDALYRWTSPVYWIARLLAVVRRLLSTNRGRIVAGVGVLLIAIISGIASGVAQGWFEQLTKASPTP